VDLPKFQTNTGNNAPDTLHKDGKTKITQTEKSSPSAAGNGKTDTPLKYVAPQMVKPTWSLSSSSAARYSHTNYYLNRKEWDKDTASDAVGGSLRAGGQWDKLMMDVVMPMDHTEFGGAYDHLDNTQLGVIGTPRYAILSDGPDLFDLTIGLPVSYFHAWYEKESTIRQDPADLNDNPRKQKIAMSGFDNPDYLSCGPLLSAGKTWGKFSASLGSVMQRTWNLDGDTNDNATINYLDSYVTGLNLGYALTDRWSLNALSTYTHTAHLPAVYDADTMQMGGTIGYNIKGRWTLDLTVLTDVFNTDQQGTQYHLGFNWLF
jgi:hypothetical protein